MLRCSRSRHQADWICMYQFTYFCMYNLMMANMME